MHPLRPLGGAAMRRLIVVVAALLLLAAADAHAAATPALRLGSHGQRVKNLQWLLTGNQPSHYSVIHPLRGRKPNGVYGARTGKAVAAAKWRLGYPAADVNQTAGALLPRILLGKRKRPLAWIGTAAKRQARLKHEEAAAKVSACQRRVVETAESQVGVREEPDGSNWGPQVANYQAVTGAYHAPWCASFAQWVLVHAGDGPFADRSAGVYYIRGWAYQRGLLRATPRPGVLVLFLTSSGHMGLVVKVEQHGFWSVEGNYGNRVAKVYHPFSRASVFVYLPGCSAATAIVNPPSQIASLYDSSPFEFGVLLALSVLAWLITPPHHVIRRRRNRD